MEEFKQLTADEKKERAKNIRKKYYEKIKNDPEKYAKMLAKRAESQKQWRQDIKNDPEKYEEVKAQRRKYSKQNWSKKHNKKHIENITSFFEQ